MPRWSKAVIVVLALGLAATWRFAGKADVAGTSPEGAPAPARVARAPSGGPEGWGQRAPMSEAERERIRQEMMERMVDQSDLSAKEKAAAKQALKAKAQARRPLEDELTRLRRVANKSKPSDKELKDALAAYRSALAGYRKKVEAADGALVKRLSLKGQLRCLSLGILDNGLGPMGMARSGGPAGPAGQPRQRPPT
jgi:hypothetical protein